MVWGSSKLKPLLNKDWLNDISDIFCLHQHADAMLAMEGFASKSVTQLLAAIERAKKVPLARYIYALGIAGVGETLARTLAQRYGSLESLQCSSQEQLESVDDVGSIVATSIIAFFNDPRNVAMVAQLAALGVGSD